MYRFNAVSTGSLSQLASRMLAATVLLAALTLTACESSTLVEPDGQRETDVSAWAPADVHARKPSDVNRQLAAARAGTAGFHKVEDALTAGFEPVSPCVEDPSEGGMGYHYANPENTALDPAYPQLLLYEPQKNGRLRLVGVEYLVPYAVVPESAAPPRLFEQDFHPTPHLEAWTLHAWVWRNNPAGLFADYNPRVSCQYADESE